jgi:protein required for attachment to host cells
MQPWEDYVMAPSSAARKTAMRPAAANLWVLVADGGRALVYERLARGRLRPVPTLSFEGPHAHDRDYGTDRPGRVFASAASARRAAADPKVPLSERAERTFLAGVVQTLEAALTSGSFQRLVVFAAPRALAEIRRRSGTALTDAIVAAAPIDLVRRPASEVTEHLNAMKLDWTAVPPHRAVPSLEA